MSSSLSWLGPLAVGVLFQYAGEQLTIAVVSGWALIIAVTATVAPSLREIPPQRGLDGAEPSPLDR